MSESGSALQFGSPEYLRQVSAGVHPPAMFATAPEITRTHHLGDMDHPIEVGYDTPDAHYHYFSTKEELLNHRLEDDTRLIHDIRDNGFDWSKEPIWHPTIRNDVFEDGHHRLAAMNAYRPDEFMPIHTER